MYYNTARMVRKKGHQFYDQEYFSQRDYFPDHLAETLKLIFRKRQVKKILDVGCGDGQIVSYLNRNGFQATGCDSADAAIKISGQIKADATNLPFSENSFEAVMAISLIEHLTSGQFDKFLKETRRVLIPAGYFFLVTPNRSSPLRIIEGKNWFAYRDPTHVQYYSPTSLKRILKKQGFGRFRFRFPTSVKTKADWWPHHLASPPQFIQSFLNYLFISSPLAYLRNSFWVLCQKRP